MDDQEYLEPGFDPSTLTMPRLRSILVAHSIDYPASAKKAVLVQIFNENVLPQARKLRAANARVKRTSRGIEDVTPVKDEFSDEEVPVPVPVTRSTRTPRRTTRARTEEAEELPPPSRGTRHSTAPPESAYRRASSKHARTTELDTIPDEPSVKRTASRKSYAVTPVMKQESEDDSPFTHDNVFQSGSSPIAPSTDRRRTTSGAMKSTSRSRTQESRRRTDDVQAFSAQRDGIVVPSRQTFEVPLARIKQEDRDVMEPSEEFVPEESALVAQDQSNALAIRPKRKSTGAGVAKTGVSAMLTALIAAFGYLYSEEKFKVGYCGVGQASSEIGGVEIPEWADAVRPVCEPCPPHAYCHDNLQTVCEPGFVLTPHPLNIGSLLPLVPTCEPDTARTRKVEAVKQRAVEELREQNAKYECGEAPKAGIQESDLKRAIATRKRRDMSNEEFEDLWASALGEIHAVEEITSGSDGLAMETPSSDQPHSRDFRSAVPSEDPFNKRLEDMFGAL